MGSSRILAREAIGRNFGNEVVPAEMGDTKLRWMKVGLNCADSARCILGGFEECDCVCNEATAQNAKEVRANQ